jgi:hypothetical protein
LILRGDVDVEGNEYISRGGGVVGRASERGGRRAQKGGKDGKVYHRISNAWESEEDGGSEIYPLWVSATDSTLFRRQ